ncbi:MAG: ATP-binding protein [Acidobacteriia bacterium]|nr:ATP-binding protein [Terriglobia bacterium]
MTELLYSLPVHTDEDVVAARQAAREIAKLLDFDGNDQTRIAAAVSEIARNAQQYAGGGKVDYLLDAAAGWYTIRISDEGPGIADVKKVLAGSSPNSGAGLGILAARRLMDDFQIESAPGSPTVVKLSRRVPGGSPRLTPRRTATLAKELASVGPRNLLDEFIHQNQELLRFMAELRARQEDLETLNAELEDTNRGVVALYAELEEKADRLRRADQTKSRFLSHMSHEFRTPLTSIMALSRLLLDQTDGTLTPEQKKQAHYIRKSAENLLEMVNDLLDLARVEAGKSVVRPAKFHVTNLFGALRGVLRPLQVSGAVELIFEEPDNFPVLDTDESKVAQILRNLIANALKFTERGVVRVSVRLSSDGRNALFSVADTGIGIAPEHLELIFQEFAQIDAPLQSRLKGTGLGLPLSKGLAVLLGGDVRVESTIGKGSIFYAEIPVVYESADRRAAVEGCDILLIDDEEVPRYLVRQCLGSAFQYAEASGGREGLELARKLKPRAILLDLRMDDLSGFEVLHQIKADAATRDIPVFIMTARALTKEERDTLNLEAEAVYSKEMLSDPDACLKIRAGLDSVLKPGQPGRMRMPQSAGRG